MAELRRVHFALKILHKISGIPPLADDTKQEGGMDEKVDSKVPGMEGAHSKDKGAQQSRSAIEVMCEMLHSKVPIFYLCLLASY